MFQNQNAARVIYMNVSLKGTDCLQNSFDGIFILSDKVAFMSELLRLQPLPGKPLDRSHSASCWQRIRLHFQ